MGNGKEQIESGIGEYRFINKSRRVVFKYLTQIFKSPLLQFFFIVLYMQRKVKKIKLRRKKNQHASQKSLKNRYFRENSSLRSYGFRSYGSVAMVPQLWCCSYGPVQCGYDSEAMAPYLRCIPGAVAPLYTWSCSSVVYQELQLRCIPGQGYIFYPDLDFFPLL